ncbi:hypothetical protein GGH96_004722 [Coemansia sp. RSA 1972]|nr:hypothetical protein GGH96_004722 [Coemansia sp. RSA 1972]
MEAKGLKRKLAGAQVDDGEGRKKRELNANGGQDNGSCLGKRKHFDDTRSTKRQRTYFDAEDMVSQLSVIEMPLSLRARAFLPSVSKEQDKQKDCERGSERGNNALVVYSPPVQVSDKVSQSMDVD